MSPAQPVAFALIRHFIFDIDGVLTDGTVYVMPGGEQVRRMNIKDGYAIQLADKMGYSLLIVSGSAPSAVADRLGKLGLDAIHFSVSDKADFISTHMQQACWDPKHTLYMGDDLPDLSAMMVVGLSACPSDAASELRAVANYISPYGGGRGCVRDVIEQVLRSNNHWIHSSDIRSR
ncbi:MAG: 3-deoxy-D-manno-octulosonate 8-phosphate phosphatase [Bacteroidetes bacterium]|nr:3-deoxy-D-manno-octulosonate 8-phosphate phosphatase [Bacteroidota bacterium]